MLSYAYYLPFYPIIIRFIFSILNKNKLNDILDEPENDRDNIRSLILSLSGFSFTALTALILLQSNLQIQMQASIYFIFISFILYFSSLNLQGYKSNRWHDILSDTLIETASFCLILTIISLLFVSTLSDKFIYGISIMGLFIWNADFLIRLNIQMSYLHEQKNMEKKNVKKR